MIRPISQNILNQLSNPNAQSLAQLANTGSRLTQLNQQANRDKLNAKTVGLQQDDATIDLMAKSAPLITNVLTQAKSLPIEQQLPFIQSGLASVPSIAGQFDESDIQPGRIDQNIQNLQKLVSRKTGSKPFAARNAQGQEVFVRDTASGLQQVEGFSPPEKGALVNVINGQKETPGRKKVDEKFADTVVDFKARGGFADANKNIVQLSRVINNLEKGNISTGPVRGLIPDDVKKFTSPELLAAKQSVQEVVQRNLRVILGAQFTEKEAEQLISRAFDEGLGSEENIRRLKLLRTQMRDAAQSKNESIKFFEQNGTLTGFKGKTFSNADFSPSVLFGDDEENPTEGLEQLNEDEQKELIELRKRFAK